MLGSTGQPVNLTLDPPSSQRQVTLRVVEKAKGQKRVRVDQWRSLASRCQPHLGVPCPQVRYECACELISLMVGEGVNTILFVFLSFSGRQHHARLYMRRKNLRHVESRLDGRYLRRPWGSFVVLFSHRFRVQIVQTSEFDISNLLLRVHPRSVTISCS